MGLFNDSEDERSTVSKKPASFDQTQFEGELLVKQFVNIQSLHVNVAQTVIITTEDKMRLCLEKHLKRMELKREWITPFSVWLSIIVTLTTTTPINFLLPAQTWFAVFVIAAIGTFIWFLWLLKAARKSTSLEDVIDELKKE